MNMIIIFEDASMLVSLIVLLSACWATLLNDRSLRVWLKICIMELLFSHLMRSASAWWALNKRSLSESYFGTGISVRQPANDS